MSATENQATKKPSEDFTKTWRYKVGLFMIIVGNLGIVVGVALGAVGFSAGTVGTFVLGGEVVSLASIVFLGKAGFMAIKSKIVGAVKASYTAPVGKIRHTIGIVLLVANVFTTYTLALYAWTAFDRTTPEDPMPAIWGLEWAQQGSLVFWLLLIGELSFLVAIYVLGAEWWEKFRRIFVWEPAES